MELTEALEFLQNIAWPLVILVMVVMFRQPLMQIGRRIDPLLARATELKVGPVSVEIEKRAITAGHPEISDAIIGISSEALKTLLNNPSSSSYIYLFNKHHDPDGKAFYRLKKDKDLEKLWELEDRKLLEFTSDPRPLIVSFKESQHAKLDTLGELILPIEEVEDELQDLFHSCTYRTTELGAAALQILYDTLAGQLSSK